MAAKNNLGKQFDHQDMTYRYLRESPTTHSVFAHHADAGLIGMLKLEQDEKNPTRGLRTSLAFVDPEFQKRGIGSTMYHISHHEVGYAPGHDNVLTKEGKRFVQSVSGGDKPGWVPHPMNVRTMKSWGHRANRAEMQKIQADNWQAATPIDPALSQALTPPKPSRRRKQKEPEQLMIPGTEHL